MTPAATGVFEIQGLAEHRCEGWMQIRSRSVDLSKAAQRGRQWGGQCSSGLIGYPSWTMPKRGGERNS